MLFTNWNNKRLSYAMVLIGLVTLVPSYVNSADIFDDNNSAFVRMRRALKIDETGLSNPAGLVFSSRAKAFHIMKGRRPGQRLPARADLIKLAPTADRVGSARIAAAIKNPINMAFDNKANRLLIFQSAHNKLIEVLERPDGNLRPTTLIRHDARHLNLKKPQGMTVDPVRGHLFILDNAAHRIVRIEPKADGSFENAVISIVDLQPSGLVDVRGLAFDPTTGNLHVLNPAEKKLYELTQTGKMVTTRNLSEFELGDPQGMVFAPSGDQTDDPLQMSLYLADSGLVAQTAAADVNAAAQTPGQIIELSFLETPAAAASTFQSSLIQTIDAWQWSPPSPDSAGIVYLPASDRLLVCDSEVNEMPIFTGDNLFEATLTGNLINTLTTVSFSDEPTGVTLNPSNGHLFFSDDTGSRSIYEMNPGPDGQYNTSDDIITSFKTSDFGSNDPEGVTFASGLGALFMTDGVNEEVYQITPGGNGIFDGVPPAGDDQVTSFDTTGLGALDPEGIAFNANSGNLYLVGKPSDTLFEVTISGVLVQTIDISAANARKPAGLAYAPGSLNSSIMNIYIAARGVDNNSDPDENDGQVYEMTLPTNTNQPPVANNDSASTTLETLVTIDVAANDTDPNGNLDPTSANTTCGTCSEPVNGNLINHGDGSFSYTPDPGFTGSDSFVYEICDTEPLCDTATVDITVTISNDPPVANDDNASTLEDTPVTIDVAANDSDPDGNLDPTSANTTCAICANPANGSLLNHNDGSFTYTPAPDFNGADNFIYEICDMLGACDTATVNISINSVNDPPVANDDSANTFEDMPVTIDVAANDSDPDGNLDSASANTTCGTCSVPLNGILDNNGDGSFDYTPDPGFSGSDSFVYEICDTEPLCDTATADITVNPAGPMTIEIRVSASTDDAEEKSTGGMRMTSSDLELVYDRGDQTVGMRFNGVEIPQGATITSAYIQFQVDEVNTVATNLSIQGQASDSTVTFTASTGNVSSRPRTVAAVSWAPGPWTTKGEAGPGQQTPAPGWKGW